nr:acyltransferase family protein [Sphingomonas guangdongensis]
MRLRATVRHANSLDLLRLIAASAVIVGHSWPILGQPDPPLLGTSVNALGVFAFFAISGYLITKSWSADRNLARFWASARSGSSLRWRLSWCLSGLSPDRCSRRFRRVTITLLRKPGPTSA